MKTWWSSSSCKVSALDPLRRRSEVVAGISLPIVFVAVVASEFGGNIIRFPYTCGVTACSNVLQNSCKRFTVSLRCLISAVILLLLPLFLRTSVVVKSDTLDASFDLTLVLVKCFWKILLLFGLVPVRVVLRSLAWTWSSWDYRITILDISARMLGLYASLGDLLLDRSLYSYW